MVTRSVAVACAAIAAAATSGCVSVQQVPMQKDFWSQTDRSVMVALAKLPETAAHKAGPQGLLDVAINNAMADDLGNALKTITLDDSYGQARSEVVRRLQQKGIKSSFTEKMVDVASLQDFSGTDNSRSYASKDFRAMKPELGSADRLLLFTVVAVGTQRSYYGFVPISSPVAILRARGELIDLQTNEVLWRDDTANTAAIADPWDQPPAFQNVGAAVQQVILEARGAMIQKLFNEATPAAAPPVATLSAAAATNSAPTLAPGTPAPETLAPENRPGPGSLWNYSFHDRVFGNRDREFSVRTTTVEDSNVMEVLSSGSEQQVISTNPREIAFQTRRLSGEEFIELSPYLLASLSTPAATLRQAPRTYPGPGSVQD